MQTPHTTFVLLVLLSLAPVPAPAQQVVTEPERVIHVVRGTSALLRLPDGLERVSISDPEIADAVVVSPREIMVNARSLGTTSLIVWREGENVHLFNVEVTADVEALRREIRTLYPGEDVSVATVGGGMVVLSGTLPNPAMVRRIVELAQATGAVVVDDIQTPRVAQILLHVRFAEVDRSFLRNYGSDLFVMNPDRAPAVSRADTSLVETLSEGIVRMLLVGDGARLESVIRALKSRGQFRSLAEPNLIAVEGQEATFLAGGEFPFPVVQGGQLGAVTIMWKEFGVRLRFTPSVTDEGDIRLRVAPEVSSLDFSNGLTLAGFQIPSLLTRRVETEVELRPGQHLAIAGLLDNSTLQNVDKIPILGDIPILGLLFQSRDLRERRTELLVIVTPHLVTPTDTPPPVPTGEPGTWDWHDDMAPPDTTAGARAGGGGGR